MLLRKKEEIEAWLNKYDIQNYEFIRNEIYGYVINVNGNVKLYNKQLKSIQVKFNEINGNFDCSSNQLKTLEGSPEIVNGSFFCSNNQFISLKGCSKAIKKNFNCSDNQLKTLEYCPKVMRNFFCENNELTIGGLNDLTKEVIISYIDISNNPELGDLQNINDFNVLKEKLEEIFKIKDEKEQLLKIFNKNEKQQNKTVNKI